MARLNQRAGQNIRSLAIKRRTKAILSVFLAGFIVWFPFWLVKMFDTFLKQVSPQTYVALKLPAYFYGIFVAIAIGLIFNGIYLWRRANRADQGALGEAETAQAIQQLEQENWQIEYGLLLGNRLGDADIVCLSPKGRAYVIDVKSHRGEVCTDGKRLYRQMGKSTYEFEKDFLDRAMQQALQVKKQKKLSFVTPIVAFSNAKVSVPARKLRGVYVVQQSQLLSLLRSSG